LTRTWQQAASHAAIKPAGKSESGDLNDDTGKGSAVGLVGRGIVNKIRFDVCRIAKIRNLNILFTIYQAWKLRFRFSVFLINSLLDP